MKASRMHDNLSAYAKGVLGEAAVCDRLTDGGNGTAGAAVPFPFWRN